MGMTTGGRGGYSSDINVTPMIDVLLVLLIIFMVIVPVTPKGLEALVPQPPKDNTHQQQPPDRTVIVELLEHNGGAPMYKINEKDTDIRALQADLTNIYANRAERVMFVTVCERVDGDTCVKGKDTVDFRYVAEVIDIARAAGVEHIGLMTPKILAGQ